MSVATKTIDRLLMKPDREKEREGRERRLRKLIRGYKSINLKIIQWLTTCVCVRLSCILLHAPATELSCTYLQ